jgi:diguanylate cyclase (GGDEF)-like protein/PAS domain S-box-containing protein
VLFGLDGSGDVEPRLVRGESRLRAVAGRIPALLWTVDEDLVFRSAPEGLSNFGLEVAAPPGTSLSDFCGQGDPESGPVAAHRLALLGESVSFEMELGGRFFRGYVEPQRDAAGALIGAVGLALDATNERLALHSLQRSEETLALAQSAAHLGSWTQDFACGEQSWSREMYALCGLEPDCVEASEELLRRHIHVDDRLALEAAIEVARESRRSFALDTRLIRYDGAERWMQHRGRFWYEGKVATRVVGTMLDITARKRAEENLAYRANFDPLTDLPNRKLLADRLQQALLHAQHNAAMMAVLYVDLDRFKTINDSLGHSVGDDFLRAVAVRLIGAVRETDTVARSGGDEFVIVLPEIDAPDEAARVAERVVASLAQPFVLDARELYCSASVGISVFPGDGDTPDALVRNADAALYRAKNAGRGSFHFYTASTQTRALDRLDLEHKLRRALERDEFTLYYQPIVDRFERTIAVEALLRWQHPELGTISPDRFIPLCEEVGLIVPLGRWVMYRAIAQLRAWRSAGLRPMRLALNISPRQAIDPDLVGDVRAGLALLDGPPDQLELEITESILLSDVANARRTIADLKSLGVRLSLDDFGTGYSALAYLKRLPVDTLKIDRAFVRDLPGDRGDAAIVSAVVALGHAMDIEVVAEGVESAEQALLLRRLGCDALQGFHFSRPLPAERLEAVLRAWDGASLA